MRKKVSLLLAFFPGIQALLLFMPASAEIIAHDATASGTVLRAEKWAGGLEYPWSLVFLDEKTLLVTERDGRLRLIEEGKLLKEPVQGVPAVFAEGQGGLLDLVLDPAFAENKRLYFSFAEPGEQDTAGTAVARASLVRDEKGARLNDVTVIFRQEPKIASSIHFGARLVFAEDGTLFVTLGERGRKESAQDLTEHLGKVVRIAPDGALPPDNPFADAGGSIRPEIWSYGHRNPQGAARDPVTSALLVVEHGPRGGDEVNNARKGANYGWPVVTHGVDYSGAAIGIGESAPGMEEPLHVWVPSIAPSGLAVYTGDLMPEWQGDLLLGALAGQMLVRLDRDEKGYIVGEERLFQEVLGRIRDVRMAPDGALFLLTDAQDGAVIRIAPER